MARHELVMTKVPLGKLMTVSEGRSAVTISLRLSVRGRECRGRDGHP